MTTVHETNLPAHEFPAPASAPAIVRAGYAAGFADMARELDAAVLAWQGTPPDWLRGELVRAGPALFSAGGHSYRHWFDGQSMLHRFGIGAEGVLYTNRFLRGASFEAANGGRIGRNEFATNAHAPYWSRVLATFRNQTTDNCNVNVVAYGDGEYVALTEVPRPMRVDCETLATLGAFAWADTLTSHLTTAHPMADAARGLIYNCDTVFHQPCLYRFTRMQPGSARREVVAEIAVDRPAYMHSFGMSENCLVLVEFPFITHPARMLLSGRPFVETYRWRPDRGLLFTIVDKDSGRVLRKALTEPCFGFHLVNAFERDGELVLDAVVYDDADVVQAFYLKRLLAGGGTVTGELARFCIPLGGGMVRRESLSDVPAELPVVDTAREGGRDHRFVWAVGQAGGFMDRLQCYDLHTGDIAVWQGEDAYPGEAVFVPRPGSSDAGDGVVLSVVLDGARGVSFLLVADAVSLQELARAYVPHVVPFGFHGSFYAAARAQS